MANPTMTLIASQVLGTSATSITFSSIPQTYTDLKLVFSARNTAAGAAGGIYKLNLNSDTSSLYSDTYIIASGNGTIVSNIDSSVTQTYFGNLSTGALDSSGNTANTFASCELYIPNYTSTSSKQMLQYSVGEDNTISNGVLHLQANLYRGASAITFISIGNYSTASFVANSSFYLYGIKNS